MKVAKGVYRDGDNRGFIGGDAEYRSLVQVGVKLWRLIHISNPNCDLEENKNGSASMFENQQNGITS